MILGEITINSVVFYISMDGFDDVHLWAGYIISFGAPEYQLSQDYGGHCKLGFGSIELSPDLFSGDWPPPVSCAITIKYLDDDETDETQAETVFDGTAYLAAPGITEESVVYNLHGTTYDVDLLAESAVGYGSVTITLPRAFGTVTHVNPVRLVDVGGKPTYHKGYIASTTPGSNWSVFDDGINVDANVTDNADGTFSLSAGPVGEVTQTGDASQTTLSGIMSWACGASYLDLTYDSTYARGTSPDVNFWASSQEVLIEFLDGLASFFSHLFYIKSSTLYLVDMLIDNGTRTLTENDFMDVEYKYKTPVRILESGWQTRAAVTETIGQYVKTTDNETFKASAFPYGRKISVTPYHDAKADIDTALDNILTILHKPYCPISIPVQGSLPVPGEAVSWTDTAPAQDLEISIRARTISYDFDNDEVKIIGEGAFVGAVPLSDYLAVVSGGDYPTPGVTAQERAIYAATCGLLGEL